MTPLDMGGLCAAIAAGSVVCGYLWGRERSPEPPDDLEQQLDDAWDEGYENGRHDEARREVILDVAVTPESAPAWACASSNAESASGDRPLAHLSPAADWRETVALELAPEHLDAEAEQLSLPGLSEPIRHGSSQAGELHPERPLPVVLHLGDEFDGSTGTFSRVELRQFQMRTEYDRGQAAFCREMGIEYRSPWQEAA
jgi:hypothetical protein